VSAHIRKVGLALALWIVLPCLLIEVGLRLFDPLGVGYFTEAAEYFRAVERGGPWAYLNPAGAEFQLGGAEVRINRHGLRGPEFTVSKPPGSRRLLVLGDSVVFGWGVAQEDIFPALLQRKLAAAGAGVEVIAAGAGSWNTRTEYEFLRELGIDYEPDVLLLVIVANDIEPKRGARSEVPEERLFEHSAPGRRGRLTWLADEVWGALATRSHLAGSVQFLRARSRARPGLEELRDSPQWQDARLALEGIARLCRSKGIELVVTLFASDRTLAGGSPLLLYEEVLAAQGIPAHRVPDALFRDASLRNSVVDSHPNAAGHALLAEALYADLASAP